MGEEEQLVLDLLELMGKWEKTPEDFQEENIDKLMHIAEIMMVERRAWRTHAIQLFWEKVESHATRDMEARTRGQARMR